MGSENFLASVPVEVQDSEEQEQQERRKPVLFFHKPTQLCHDQQYQGRASRWVGIAQLHAAA